MKYIILLSDGMPDYPLEELGGKTPLEAADTPNMDSIAQDGSVGMVETVYDGFHPGSDVCNLVLLGYDPSEYYSGRAPLEAASMGVKLDRDDVAFRCNLVTLKQMSDSVIMEDFSAGHISTEMAGKLIALLQDNLGDDEFHFYPGVSYRHLLVWKGGATELNLTPPHDIIGKDIRAYIPGGGEGASKINKLMSDTQMLLANHQRTQKKGSGHEHKANSAWFWGHGKAPVIPAFKERFGLNGSLVAAVDLLKGIGIYLGFDIVDVPGATGYLDTNFKGKAEYALKELEKKDFVYLHVEAPDEAGHAGSAELKVKAIEDFDSMVVGTVLEGMEKFGDYRILLTSDHRTPVSLKTHSEEAVPFGIYPALEGKTGAESFSEKIIEKSKLKVEKGHELIRLFLGG